MTEPASAARIRALHSHVVDAVIAQDPDTAIPVTQRLGGLHSGAFVQAVEAGRHVRIRSAIEADTLVYLVEIRTDNAGWVVLTRPTATALGIADTPELRQQELTFHAERLLREMTGDEQ